MRTLKRKGGMASEVLDSFWLYGYDNYDYQKQ